MKNIKHNIIILILVTVFGVIGTFNYFQQNKLATDRNKIKNNFVKNDFNRKIKKEMYSEILKDMEEKKGVNIKNITKKNKDNLVTLDLEFKGRINLLNDFLKHIKTKKNLYRVSLIKIEKQSNNIYSGRLIVKFRV